METQKNTIKNERNTKGVNITTQNTGTILAMYVQYCIDGEQVLQSKSFTSVKNAEKWAYKILN